MRKKSQKMKKCKKKEEINGDNLSIKLRLNKKLGLSTKNQVFLIFQQEDLNTQIKSIIRLSIGN